ncbi:unnamed protein product [Aphanomyces euteiches]|uniref:Uncharacterized protein n=1 Tax=Aphanomyces euteiches TaxID=100861 RepID=A0A6G0WRV2_9STRA|nr:hypothetical protein Ae201684_012190 [Aphanomyces euteiches]KAH9096538.1 hypothetical protein Ae201684P_013206 [Aphanomyces euteiches]KAH9155112.1 hypothetical protein AeRB84_002892 [Aphanomyces euteiches]
MWFAAVHIGAGKHGRDTAAAEASMRVALDAAGRVLASGGTAVAAAEAAVIVLEDADATNAGCNGPHVNLTTDGRVQTDASVADGATGMIGCCGAVEGVRNPISLAAHLLRNQEAHQEDARQPPLFLVGDGAVAAAREAGLSTIDYSLEPVHASALKKHEDKAAQFLLDTVGAICLDSSGVAAAAVSSAGIALKQPGRVGHAGCPRMGCCARIGSSTYAFSCTGRGEHLMQAGLLQHLERHIVRSEAPLNTIINDTFQEAKEWNGGYPVEGGVIGFVRRNGAAKKRRRDESSPRVKPQVDFFTAFSTPSMGIGMLSSSDTAPHTHILRMANPGSLSVHVCTIAGKS